MPVLLFRLLPFVIVGLLGGGCALVGDPAPARGCPPVYIVQEMSQLTTPGYTAQLRGVRDVVCRMDGQHLVVEAAVLTRLAVPRPVGDAHRVVVPLKVAAIDHTGREVVTQTAITRTVTFAASDAPRATRHLNLDLRLAGGREIGTVYVGLMGGAGR